MAQGSRPDRVGEQIRQLLSGSLAREVHDPGLGFVTLTRVRVSADLQMARVFYTSIGDDKARNETRRALDRAMPFLRRQLGRQLRLRRVPELVFQFDESIESQERIERILIDLKAEREAREAAGDGGSPPQDQDDDDR
jgi:ribosome-binding factor A